MDTQELAYMDDYVFVVQIALSWAQLSFESNNIRNTEEAV